MTATRLSELNPVYNERTSSLSFQCPRCRLGIVSIDLKNGAAAPPLHGSSGLPPDFETLTITPSIAAEGMCRRCPGWHGHITNGEAR